jgi:hypothetical protein
LESLTRLFFSNLEKNGVENRARGSVLAWKPVTCVLNAIGDELWDSFSQQLLFRIFLTSPLVQIKECLAFAIWDSAKKSRNLFHFCEEQNLVPLNALSHTEMHKGQEHRFGLNS